MGMGMQPLPKQLPLSWLPGGLLGRGTASPQELCSGTGVGFDGSFPWDAAEFPHPTPTAAQGAAERGQDRARPGTQRGQAGTGSNLGPRGLSRTGGVPSIPHPEDMGSFEPQRCQFSGCRAPGFLRGSGVAQPHGTELIIAKTETKQHCRAASHGVPEHRASARGESWSPSVGLLAPGPSDPTLFVFQGV